MARAHLPPERPTLPAPLCDTEGLQTTRQRGDTWGRIAHKLGWREAARTRAATLQLAREACSACLSDLPLIETRGLRQLLGHARSLAELWHLRPELYRRLALHHSQAEAERRLARLSRWFDANPAALRGAPGQDR